MGTPHRVCRTFARFDFILVPLPAARITAKIGGLSDMYSHHSYRVRLTGGRVPHAPRLGRQDSNLRSRDQNPVPCHLATPQYRPAQIIPERLFAVRIGLVPATSVVRTTSVPLISLFRQSSPRERPARRHR